MCIVSLQEGHIECSTSQTGNGTSVLLSHRKWLSVMDKHVGSGISLSSSIQVLYVASDKLCRFFKSQLPHL